MRTTIPAGPVPARCWCAIPRSASTSSTPITAAASTRRRTACRLIPGGEAAGKVVEVGEGVDWLKPGDRIAYTTPLGAYAEER